MKVRRLTTNGYVGLADGSYSLSDEGGRAAEVDGFHRLSG